MLKIMSFNIRYGTASDGGNSWACRKSLVIDRIRAFNPDLIGLQECRDDEQAEYIRTSLDDYVFIGLRRGGDGDPASSDTGLGDPGIEMAPLLYRNAAFDELGRGHFWLSKTPFVSGSVSWGGKFPRTVSWVRLRTTYAPFCELVFLNTHFDYANAQVMRESARLLRRWIDRLGKIPLILTGDFNATKDQPPYRILTRGFLFRSQPLVDSHATVTPAGTLHAFGSLARPLAIDWVLVSKAFCTLSAMIDSYHQDTLYPSDHYPLLVMVQLPAGHHR